MYNKRLLRQCFRQAFMENPSALAHYLLQVPLFVQIFISTAHFKLYVTVSPYIMVPIATRASYVIMFSFLHPTYCHLVRFPDCVIMFFIFHLINLDIYPDDFVKSFCAFVLETPSLVLLLPRSWFHCMPIYAIYNNGLS